MSPFDLIVFTVGGLILIGLAVVGITAVALIIALGRKR
jgi:hypothetical protein